MARRSGQIAGLVAAVVIAGCGSGGGNTRAETQAPGVASTAPTTVPTTMAKPPATTTPASSSTATTPPPTTAPSARKPTPAPRPIQGSGAAALATACRDARRLHPAPRRPAAASGLKAYALASLPGTQATLAALQSVRLRGRRGAALTTAYAALLSLYRQLAAAPAAAAGRLGTGLKNVESVVAVQARAAGVPACAPPAA